jgi:hypothetical protein
MSNSPRLPETVQAILAERGWRATGSSAGVGVPKTDHSQLVFVGNWQDPCPRRLLFDSALEPVDIVTWQIIRIHADASKVVAFPSYTDLMRAVRVSRATIARALAILRLTRWLPLCAALRDADGRFAGHVYALTDEPLPLADALGIDAGYVEFTEHAQRHRSAHIRTLARDVFAGIEAAAIAPAGADLAPVRIGEHLMHRLDQMLHLARDRVQNLNADQVQKLNSACSSSYIKTTTTTTPATRSAAKPQGASDRDQGDVLRLIFPEALSLIDSQRRVLALRLEPVSASLRQAVLDEAAGRILAKRLTRDPVRCTFDYVARLCAKALDGQFVLTDAGDRVRHQRDERAKTEGRLRRAREHSEARRLKELEEHRARTQSVKDRG